MSAPHTNQPLVHVFDLGNVLLFVHEEVFYQKLLARCRAGAPAVELFYEHFGRNNVSCGGDFNAIYSALAQEAGLTMTLEEFRLAWNDAFSPNPPMIEFVRGLPRPLYLLSNTNEPHVSWFHEHYPYILELFDACVFSNEVGLRKPDPAIYRHVEGLSGQPPARHVFVDDMAENVEGALAAGWRGIVFRGVEDCRRQLGSRDA